MKTAESFLGENRRYEKLVKSRNTNEIINYWAKGDQQLVENMHKFLLIQQKEFTLFEFMNDLETTGIIRNTRLLNYLANTQIIDKLLISKNIYYSINSVKLQESEAKSVS